MTQDTPTVEELARKFCNSFALKLVPSNDAMIATRLLRGLVPELLKTYGNARYEEGVKAERERILGMLSSQSIHAEAIYETLGAGHHYSTLPVIAGVVSVLKRKLTVNDNK